MPNITPGKYRDSYKLYDNKPCTDDSAEDCQSCLEARVSLADAEVIYGEWGDSKHYSDRRVKSTGINEKNIFKFFICLFLNINKKK